MRAALVTLLSLGCTSMPGSYRPIAECGTPLSEPVAHRAGCVAEVQARTFNEDRGEQRWRTLWTFDEHGLYLHKEVFLVGEPQLRIDWERDATGEVLRRTTRGIHARYETVYTRDERGMVLREEQLGRSVTNYDVDPDRCTWSTAERRQFGFPITHLTAEWVDERMVGQHVERSGTETETRWSYNADGQVTKQVERSRNGTKRQTMNYDRHGRLVSRTSRGDGTRRRWRWLRDEDGWETRVELRINGKLVSGSDTERDGPYPVFVVDTDEEAGRIRAETTWTWDCPDP